MNHEGGLRAVINADNMGSHWWLARALVMPRERRGQGVGTAMLQALFEELRKQGCVELWVTPGGYDGDTERQFRFYLKNGFVPSPTDPDLLIWRPK